MSYQPTGKNGASPPGSPPPMAQTKAVSPKVKMVDGLRAAAHDEIHHDATTQNEPGTRLSQMVAAEKAAKEAKFQKMMAEARERKRKVPCIDSLSLSL